MAGLSGASPLAQLSGGLLLICVVGLNASAPAAQRPAARLPPAMVSVRDIAAIERARVMPAAEVFLKEQPVTVTATRSPRSAGGPHDFFSEGDYWWPDPANPDGPYIQRDGQTNPDNFVEHRRAMVRLSTHVATLTSAYRLTDDERFAARAVAHLRAWFVADATRMNPSLLYAQAIQGRATGRGTGIIDTIHLVEVSRAAELLASAKSIPPADLAAIRRWFSDYINWLTTHEYGIQERDAKNNHGTCWVVQVAAFARLTGDTRMLDDCRRRYKEILVPSQMAADGSFPLELKRTKPYGYAIFNLDAFAVICQLLSSPGDDLWSWTTADGRGMRRAIAWLFPALADKATWTGAKDVMYFDQWPVRQPSLLFSGLAYQHNAYLRLWASLNGSPTTEEVIRNLPVRHPMLWVDAPPLAPTGK